MSVAAFQETKIRLLAKRSQRSLWSEERKSASIPIYKTVLIIFRANENEDLRKQYDAVLRATNQTSLAEKMIQLRKLVIDCGLPEESEEERKNYATKCSLR
jgi:hypothetical protein